MPSSATSTASATASWRAHAWRDWVGLAARVVLGGVMLVAGALKVTNLPSSVLAVRAYKLLPYDVAALVGYGLPFLEITVGLLLLLGLFTRVAAAVTGLLQVAFIVGISWAWAHGYSLDCGCFGGGGEIERAKALAQYPWEIARDLGLLVLVVWLVVRPATPYSVETRLFGPLTVHDDDLDEE
ncbi:MAG TPA: MauE/DoxX family redox-associated membrane protein [Propionibacteriaceae bacterium]|nr:MauE/DoxX family redox-associated membrane protein [Propionibacteriaceae bacterium]